MSWPAECRPTATTDTQVSVIVPARDEAADIESCLRSILAQEHRQLRVIVVNDHSTDDTPQIIDRMAAEDDRVIAVHNPPLQAGWLGKHNAMQAALKHVSGELVLLTDADVEFAPSCVGSAVADLQERRLDLLTIYPRFRFVSVCETILLPFYVGGAALLLSPRIEDPNSPHAMAVGAFILVRRERLEQIGGFQPIKTEILDDVCLARLFKKRGFTVGLRAAPDLIRLRFFKGNRHAFLGVTKHLLGGVQKYMWLAPLLAIVPLTMYVVLIAGLAYGIAEQHYILAGTAFVTLAIHYTGLLLTRPMYDFHAIKALLFPLMAVPFAASCLHAVYLYVVRGRINWRGRATHIPVVRGGKA